MQLDVLGCAASQDAMLDLNKTSNSVYSYDGVLGAEEDVPLYKDEVRGAVENTFCVHCHLCVEMTMYEDLLLQRTSPRQENIYIYIRLPLDYICIHT